MFRPSMFGTVVLENLSPVERTVRPGLFVDVWEELAVEVVFVGASVDDVGGCVVEVVCWGGCVEPEAELALFPWEGDCCVGDCHCPFWNTSDCCCFGGLCVGGV